MTSIFQVKKFMFPYDQNRFPGQATDERILYVTREHKLFFWLKMFSVLLLAIAIFLAFYVFSLAFKSIFVNSSAAFLLPLALVMVGIFLAIGWWWTFNLWQKSLAILTDKRLLKIIYTTPFNHYNQSLPLETIVDTSCNNQGFIIGLAQAVLKIGTLTARSSAASSGVATDDVSRVNKKYFYLENIKYCEDLQQYLNKILSLLSRDPQALLNFRPFIPHLKGEARTKFLEEHYPPSKTSEER